MAKVTPEFKRAFKHFIDGACCGRHNLVDDTEAALLWVATGGHVGDGSLTLRDVSESLDYYIEWRDGYTSGIEIAYKLLPVTPDMATAFMARIKKDVREGIQLDAYEELPLFDLKPLDALADVDADKWARMFAEDYAEYAADYRNRLKTAILAQLRETPDDDVTAVQWLIRWSLWACAYWYAMEAERSGRDARKTYRDASIAARRAHLIRNAVALPDTVSRAMAAFCDAYSHGVNPLTGERITPHNIA